MQSGGQQLILLWFVEYWSGFIWDVTKMSWNKFELPSTKINPDESLILLKGQLVHLGPIPGPTLIYCLFNPNLYPNNVILKFPNLCKQYCSILADPNIRAFSLLQVNWLTCYFAGSVNTKACTALCTLSSTCVWHCVCSSKRFWSKQLSWSNFNHGLVAAKLNRSVLQSTVY